MRSCLRFLVNPASGRGKGGRLVEAVRRLAQRVDASCVVSSSAGDLTTQAQRAAAEGIERLVVAGGDGTLHHALQGLVGTSTALAPVAAGTGNDLIGELGLPKDSILGLEAAIEGPIRSVDLGHVEVAAIGATNPDGSAKPSDSRYFVGVAGVGFDSEVANFVNRGVKGLPSSLVYPWGVLRTLSGFRAPVLRLEIDDEIIEEPVTLIAAANSTRFGGGMRIAPDAVMDDGLFDIVIVGAVSKLTLLKVFPKVYGGTHLSHPSVQVRRASKLRIGLDRELTLYGDGEAMAPVGPTDVVLSIAPAALRVVAAEP